jgi:hypothetical protein
MRRPHQESPCNQGQIVASSSLTENRGVASSILALATSESASRGTLARLSLDVHQATAIHHGRNDSPLQCPGLLGPVGPKRWPA